VKLTERKQTGVFVIDLDPIVDSRGSFMRSYDQHIFNEHGLNGNWIQENHSKTSHKATVRGLHFQFPPYTESKLIRCLRGAILNVFVDLRMDSPSFGTWDSVELTEDNDRMLYLPKGFANGFGILKDNSEILYKTDVPYTPEAEGRLMWNDPELAISWPFNDPILSDKDKSNMSFETFKLAHGSLDLGPLKRKT
jgi:dTDP-4-dehydrorhamnose 3,5-epimerase